MKCTLNMCVLRKSRPCLHEGCPHRLLAAELSLRAILQPRHHLNVDHMPEKKGLTEKQAENCWMLLTLDFGAM